MFTSSTRSRCLCKLDPGMTWKALKSQCAWVCPLKNLLRLHLNPCPWNMIYWCRIRNLQGIPFHRLQISTEIIQTCWIPVQELHSHLVIYFFKFSLVITTRITFSWLLKNFFFSIKYTEVLQISHWPILDWFPVFFFWYDFSDLWIQLKNYEFLILLTMKAR